MSTHEHQGVSVSAGNRHFVVEPAILAEVEVQFTLSGILFRLPCQVIERMAPQPLISLECNDTPAASMGADAKKALIRAGGSEIPAFIVSDVATTEADLYAAVPPSFGFDPGNDTAQFLMVRDRTPAGNVSMMHETTFSIINMHILATIGHQVQGSKRFQRIGGAVLADDEWTISIRQSPDAKNTEQYLKSVGGFRITHIASMHKTDGSTYSPEEARAKMASVRTFLSFANGAPIGTCRILGTNQDWQTVWEDWHGYPASWSTGQRSESWLQQNRFFNIGETQAITSLFPALIKTIESGDDTRLTIERYLSANTMQPFIDLTSNRAIGEMAAAVLSPTSSNPWRKLSAELKSTGISLDIPAECRNLQQLYNSNPEWAKPRGGSQQLDPGPTTLRELRDHFEHPMRPINGLNDSYAGRALYEAWQLGQWYLETIILARCGYTGDRANRIKGGEWGPLI